MLICCEVVVVMVVGEHIHLFFSEDDVPAAKKVKPEESNTEVMGCDPALSSG